MEVANNDTLVYCESARGDILLGLVWCATAAADGMSAGS